MTMMEILEQKKYLKKAHAVRLGLLACMSASYSLSPKHSDGFGVKSC